MLMREQRPSQEKSICMVQGWLPRLLKVVAEADKIFGTSVAKCWRSYGCLQPTSLPWAAPPVPLAISRTKEPYGRERTHLQGAEEYIPRETWHGHGDCCHRWAYGQN